MNATTHTWTTSPSILQMGIIKKIWSKETFALLVLIGLVLLSSLVIVYLKDMQRRLVSDISIEKQIRNRLDVEWQQLLLEKSTWTTDARIQQIAEQNLKMMPIKSEQVYMVGE